MKKQTKFTEKENGITLIALVITIIVLLILAGVALATLTGDSGILSNAEKAKEDTLKANAKEKVQIAIMEHKIGKYSEGKTLKEYLEAAGATDVTEAGTKGTMDWYNFEIKDVVVKITKETIAELTLKDVYTPEMIGEEINYTTTNTLPSDVKWIVIGQDKDGNVLATTNRPLGNATGEESFKFETEKGAENWLNYEENIKTHCKGIFSGTVQGKTVEARSITLKDVNNLTGYIEPEFDTYTFKDQETNDYANKVVNYYHPDETAENKWSRAEKEYENNAYEYSTTDTLNNLDLVLGPSSNRYTYTLASRSVFVRPSSAFFTVGFVDNGTVSSVGYYFGDADSSSFVPYAYSFSLAVRPVVTLSSDFQVVDQNGTWQLAE